MKRAKVVWIILLVQVLIFAIPAFADKRIVEFSSTETPPFWSANLPEDGMAGEILHAISKEIGVKSVIKYIPMERIRKNLTSNHVGNPEIFSGQEFSAIVTIAVFRVAFFYYRPNHKKEIHYTGLDDIKGFKLGIIRGTLGDVSFLHEKGIEVEPSNSEISLIKKLRYGRIDLCSMVKLTGFYKINSIFPKDAENFAYFDIKGSVRPITIMIDKTYPDGRDLGEKYSNGLERIIESGAYTEILEKYYGRGKIPRDWFMQLEKFKVSQGRH